MSKENQYYDIVSNKISKTAEVLIYGVIGESWWEESITARRFVTDFKNLEKDHDNINVRINSPGGSVFDGLAIFNAIANSPKDVHTYNDGLCASMAAVLLLAANKVNVHPAKNSLLMLHAPMVGTFGNRREIEKTLNTLDKVQDVLVTSICEKTGLQKDDVVAKYFDYTDHWLTADEAKAAGLYENIEEDEAENVPKNASALKFSDLVKLFEPKNTLFPDWINRIAQSPENLNILDMDIHKIRAAYGLKEEDYATEDDVLNYVKTREKELSDAKAAQDAAVNELATAKKSIEDKDAETETLKAQVETLKKGPGAENKKTTETTDKGGADVEDGLTADDIKLYNSLTR
ncbi:head maturation protease, ClpP-related [Mangrovibacterium sp.]|uniref:head maturation protease, ClpP-related n=1 Tax=Mangrovibacterium sp. TaxID=1961364 RepID=UPI00356867A3